MDVEGFLPEKGALDVFDDGLIKLIEEESELPSGSDSGLKKKLESAPCMTEHNRFRAFVPILAYCTHAKDATAACNPIPSTTFLRNNTMACPVT